MRIISYYVFKQCALTTLVMSGALTLIIWLTQSLRLFDIIINGGAPLGLFGFMLLLTIPRFFEVILPISIGLSILYTLNKFSQDSELVVMQNTGMSPYRLGSYVLGFIGICATVILLLGGWATPLAGREMDRLKNVVRSEYSLGLLRAGIFTTLGDDATLYIAERTSLTDLRGVFIHLNRPGELPTTITATHGGMTIRDKKPYVVVYDGMRQQLNPRTKALETLRFERYSLDLSQFLNTQIPDEIEPDERTLLDLVHYGKTLQEPRQKQMVFAEIHYRLARPMLLIAMGLLPLVPYLTGSFNRRGHLKRIAGIIGGLFILQASALGGLSLTRLHEWGTAVLYGIPLLVIATCLFILQYNQIDTLKGFKPLQWLIGGKERLV